MNLYEWMIHTMWTLDQDKNDAAYTLHPILPLPVSTSEHPTRHFISFRARNKRQAGPDSTISIPGKQRYEQQV